MTPVLQTKSSRCAACREKSRNDKQVYSICQIFNSRKGSFSDISNQAAPKDNITKTVKKIGIKSTNLKKKSVDSGENFYDKAKQLEMTINQLHLSNNDFVDHVNPEEQNTQNVVNRFCCNEVD